MLNAKKVMKKIDEAVKVKNVNEGDKIDTSKPWAMAKVGGSIGSKSGNYYVLISGKRANIVKTFDDEQTCKDTVKRFRKMLSSGEKSYYGMNYNAINLAKTKVFQS